MRKFVAQLFHAACIKEAVLAPWHYISTVPSNDTLKDQCTPAIIVGKLCWHTVCSLCLLALGKQQFASRNPTDQPVWNTTSHTDCGWKQISCVTWRTSRFPQIIFFSTFTTSTKPFLVTTHHIQSFFTQVLRNVDCASNNNRSEYKPVNGELQKEKHENE
jgi:hypothetical protein